jgi:hypothetical protein
MASDVDGPPLSLEEYAFVTSGLLDGFEVEELLAYRDIDGDRWARGQAYWDAQLLDDTDADERDEALSRLQEASRTLWRRPIPPLDEDLRAWLDFQRTVLVGENPLAELAKIPMTLGDVVALQTLWQERLRDREVAEQLTKILSEPPQPVEVPAPPRPRLPPRPARPPVAAPPAPEAPPSRPRGDAVPSLSVPLPGRAPRVVAEPAPPSRMPPRVASVPPPPIAPPSVWPPPPVAPPSAWPPPPEPRALAPQEPSPASRRSVESPWVARDRLEDTDSVGDAPQRDYVLPFVAPSSVRAPPPAIDGRPNLASGQTTDLLEQLGSALPFRAVSRTEPGEPPQEAQQAEPRASVGHYAALCVELEAAPRRHAEILQRYALTTASKEQLDRHFQARCLAEPGLREALAEAAEGYRRWRKHL